MKTSSNKGFTLIELLIVIAIISLLATTLIPTLLTARAKGDDGRRKASLKGLQTEIANQTDVGLAGYSTIFSSGEAKAKLDKLIADTGVSAGTYDAVSDATSYAVVFPLKQDPTKYWCIDSTGASKEVSGRINTTGAKECGNVVVSGGGSIPVITFNYPAPDNCSPDFVYCHYYTGGRGYSTSGGIGIPEPLQYAWNSLNGDSLTVLDAEDGDLYYDPNSTVTLTDLSPDPSELAVPGGYYLNEANINIPAGLYGDGTTPFNDGTTPFNECVDIKTQATVSVTDSDNNTVTRNRFWYYCQ